MKKYQKIGGWIMIISLLSFAASAIYIIPAMVLSGRQLTYKWEEWWFIGSLEFTLIGLCMWGFESFIGSLAEVLGL